MKRLIILPVLLMLLNKVSFSQTDSLSVSQGELDSLIAFIKADSANHAKKSHLKFQVGYLSNEVYNGRKDSVLLPYITPLLSYHHKSGLYANASLSYANSAEEKRIDLFTLAAGYDFKLSRTFKMGFDASKYFYNSNSIAIQSATKGMIGSYVSWEPDTANLSISTGLIILFSNRTDVSTNISISYSFYFGTGAKQQWSVMPTITSYQGTQQYYQEYREKAPPQIGGRSNTPPQNIKIQGSNKFVLLDYELSLPVSYDTKKWGVAFTPIYAIPKNPVSQVNANGNTKILEKLNNVFYFDVTAYFKFLQKNKAPQFFL